MGFCSNDEVYPEYEFTSGQRTLDVLNRYNENAVLIDSKAFAPKIRLRELSTEEINYSTNRIVISIIQVYTHIKERFIQRYNPFEYKEFNKEDIFGIVIVSEDNYIRRENIMSSVAEKLELGINSLEYKYLCSNVKIFSLYNLEEIIFGKYNFIELLKAIYTTYRKNRTTYSIHQTQPYI